MSSLAARRTATSLSSSTQRWASPRGSHVRSSTKSSGQSTTRHASYQRPLSTSSRTPQQATGSTYSKLASASGTAKVPVSSNVRSTFASSTPRQSPAPTSSSSTTRPAPTPSSAPQQPSSSAPPTPAARPSPPPTAPAEPQRSLTDGLDDSPLILDESSRQVDWSRSFHGLSDSPFSPGAQEALLQPVELDDIEIKPDGIIYLPEIKYRRILNKAFGPGGWGLAPRGETIVTGKSVTREYGLVAGGRLVSIARGEQQYFDPEGIPTATEGCKSNALMRCCKDLGVASELWDPRFIRRFMAEKSKEVWVEHVVTKKRKKIYMRKDDEVKYPLKEVKMGGASGAF